eukprot:8110000-Prorocentrum_lima.AAC.1
MAHRSMYPLQPLPDTPTHITLFWAHPHHTTPAWHLLEPAADTHSSPMEIAISTPVPDDGTLTGAPS